MRAALCALLAGGLATSCLSVNWTRSTLHRPVEGDVLGDYVVGESTMGDALDGLGAPLYVWELSRGAAALAWGWYGSRDLGVQVSVPTRSPVDPSFQYTQIDRRLRGYVFVFDEADALVYMRKGYLADIADELRRRPVFEVAGAEERLRERDGTDPDAADPEGAR